MKKSEFEEFSALWMAVCELTGKAPTPAAVSMTFRVLMKYQLNDIRKALDAHAGHPEEGRFSPKPANIIAYIDGDPSSKALNAWTKVIDSISRVGAYQTVVFDEKEIMAVIEGMGGWVSICQITDKELPFTRNEFVTRYKGICNSNLKRWPKKLTGITESHNHGMAKAKLTEPMLLGDQRKALAVFEGGGDKPRLAQPMSQALAQLESSTKVKYLNEDN